LKTKNRMAKHAGRLSGMPFQKITGCHRQTGNLDEHSRK